MKASFLIKQLQELVEKHGDLDVYLSQKELFEPDPIDDLDPVLGFRFIEASKTNYKIEMLEKGCRCGSCYSVEKMEDDFFMLE